jgi:predicted ATPase
LLHELRISNLKSFRGAHRVPLAPLTLIYGSNSAGKSTLIQALLLLKQTIEGSDPEQPELVVRGALADLGSIPGIMHEHDVSRTLSLGLTIDPSIPRYGSLLGSQPRRYTFSFKWDAAAHVVRQTGASLGLGDDDFLSYTRRRGPAVAQSPDQLRRRQFPFRIGRQDARETFVQWMASAMRARPGLGRTPRAEIAPQIEAAVKELLKHGTFGAAPWTIMPSYPRLTFSKGSVSGQKVGDLRDIIERFEILWRQLTNQFRTDLAAAMDSIVYLGPLRRPPARFHLISGAHRASVGREGEFLAEILSRRSDVLADVNDWLTQLEIPYSLEASRVRESDIGTAIGDVVVLVLTDQRSGIQVSPGDVGFGISQLLPIIVQTQIGRRNVVLVEQPEIHVHPRLQAEVADLFVAATQRFDNQLVVETHSEHIMLRVQRLVRKKQIDPEHVAVLYVDTSDDGTSTVLRLRLGNDGSFIDEWPRGFFEERFNELFRS